jgi:hypothetical protein
MLIDCESCEMYRTQACDDCLVTALLHPQQSAVDIDEELDPPLRALSGAGLIPVLRFRPRLVEEPGDEGPLSDTA